MERKLRRLYRQWESLLEDYRVEWEKTRHEANRKENYWQGKKDGLRTAMNMLYSAIIEIEQNGDDRPRQGERAQ